LLTYILTYLLTYYLLGGVKARTPTSDRRKSSTGT